MISAASELLAQFIAVEKKSANGVTMKHMPTLGEAYEAIVRDGIAQQFVLPPGLDLRVVSGFVEGLDNQYDCMLVHGEGQKYLRTDKYTYPIDKVLCIFEVKKTLGKADLRDAIIHLAAAQRQFMQDFGRRVDAGQIKVNFHRLAIAFSGITGREGPRNYIDLNAMPVEDSAVCASLARQQFAPLTILFGFGGYSTEKGLRDVTLDLMEETDMAGDLTVDHFPSLISVNEHSVVKCNNQPYLLSRSNHGWIFLASTRHNPALILLELIWTKLSTHFGVEMPWGDDMQLETLKELVQAKAEVRGTGFGWIYNSFEYRGKQLERAASVSWAPDKLSQAAMTVANFAALCGGEIALDDSLAGHIQSQYGSSLEDAVHQLVDSRVFSRTGDRLRAVADFTILAEDELGYGYASYEQERFARWREQSTLDLTIVNIVRVR
ncbi:MAG: DUF6602 domain-containing protein [Massilia sp.]